MGTPAHAIRDNDCLNTTGGRSFVVNGMFEEPGALEKYEASQADNDYIMAPCHVSSGAVAPHRDSVLIAVDGACRGNGQLDAMAAYAVFFAPSSRFNRSAILPTENATSTSQRAELSGGIAALEEAKQLTLVIKTDSEYLCFGATEWIAKWKKNGWKNARGRPVANRGLFQKLD
ncbi:ribonuclease H-like domain-containing protein, partial [Phyllosticta capitalensis]